MISWQRVRVDWLPFSRTVRVAVRFRTSGQGIQSDVRVSCDMSSEF